MASAIEGLNVTMAGRNKIAKATGEDATKAVEKLTRELVQLHAEVRALTGKMRG